MRKGSAKYITAGLLLFLAALPLIYILFVRVQQQTIRKRMKVRLETEALLTLTVPENKILWIKQGKEILVNGRMFDIKYTHLQNGVYVFQGLYDEKETALLKHFKETQQNGNAENKLFVRLFQFLQTCYNDSQEEFVFCENRLCHKLNTNTPSLPPGFVSIFTPPPQA